MPRKQGFPRLRLADREDGALTPPSMYLLQTYVVVIACDIAALCGVTAVHRIVGGFGLFVACQSCAGLSRAS